jgi:hypothetical protein
MPNYEDNISHNHMDCLAALGWLAFDTTHMGDPDSYLMTPCCTHGYRAVFGPRPVLDYVKGRYQQDYGQGATHISDQTQLQQLGQTELATGQATGGLETVWQWTDSLGIDQPDFFVQSQAAGSDSSWVLVAGATNISIGAPVEAQAKYWATTQTDIATIEQEYDAEDWAGRDITEADFQTAVAEYTNQYGHSVYDWNHYWWWYGYSWYRRSSTYSSTSAETPYDITAEYTETTSYYRYWGWRSSRWYWYRSYYNQYATSTLTTTATGALQGWSQDEHSQNSPGLISQSSTLPTASQLGDMDQVHWVRYGSRNLIGLKRCTDGYGATGPLYGHVHGVYGQTPNWRGLSREDYSINDIVQPGQSGYGGLVPNLIFTGGELEGVQGFAECEEDPTSDDFGSIKSINVGQGGLSSQLQGTDPGITILTDMRKGGLLGITNIQPPSVLVDSPENYAHFGNRGSVGIEVTTDPDEIKTAYPWMFKSKEEMHALLCDGYHDPIAQTFYVNPSLHPDGVFLSSVQVCFQNKPDTDSKEWVILEIRPTNNGYPDHEKVLTQKWLTNYMVNVADNTESNIDKNWDWPTGSGERRYPTFADPTGKSYTEFAFRNPCYLEPAKEYAVVIRSNSSDYRVWLAESDQPVAPNADDQSRLEQSDAVQRSSVYGNEFGGSFFISHNGSTWEPEQTKDLMFKLIKANFGALASPATPVTGSIDVRAGGGLATQTDYDRIDVSVHKSTIPKVGVTQITGTAYGLTKADADAGTTEPATVIEGVYGDNLSGESDTHDLNETMTLLASKPYEQGSFKSTYTLSTTNPDVSPVIDLFHASIFPAKNQINNGGLTVNDINILSGGSSYAIGSRFTVSAPPDRNGVGGSTANAYFKVSNLGDSGRIQADSSTRGIVMCDSGGTEVTTSGTGFYKEIVDQASHISKVSGTGSGAVFEILSEEGASQGNAKMRYVTKPVTLSDGMSARGLKVFLTAKQPFGSEIHVYYKALSEFDSDDIEQKSWKRMYQKSPDRKVTFTANREFEFTSDELISYTSVAGESFNSFKTFAVKIVGFASNDAQPPIIKNFRAISVF